MGLQQASLRGEARVGDDQRTFYRDNGYLQVECAVGADWLARLAGATAEMVERSRSIAASDKVFVLEDGHTSATPRLRRLTSPVDHHPVYRDFIEQGPIADIVAGLLGPDVKFHHSKLNFKWAEGGAEVKWHQDIQFFPHTNYDVVTVGLYLDDCGLDQGPLGVIPGSHEGPIYDQYDANGAWTGALSDEDARAAGAEAAVYLPGPAGSITIHNARTVHGSKPNLSNLGRPLLLYTLSAADAFPYTPNAIPSALYGAILRGRPARWARHDPRPCLVPPDWSGGYTSIFAAQQGEDGPKAGGM